MFRANRYFYKKRLPKRKNLPPNQGGIAIHDIRNMWLRYELTHLLRIAYLLPVVSLRKTKVKILNQSLILIEVPKSLKPQIKGTKVRMEKLREKGFITLLKDPQVLKKGKCYLIKVKVER